MFAIANVIHLSTAVVPVVGLLVAALLWRRHRQLVQQFRSSLGVDVLEAAFLYTVLVANLDTSAQACSLEMPSHGTEAELTIHTETHRSVMDTACYSLSLTRLRLKQYLSSNNLQMQKC